MQTYDTKARYNAKRINEIQKMKAATGKSKQTLVDEAWDEYYLRHRRHNAEENETETTA